LSLLGQSANNGVVAGCEDQVSRYELVGFQLAIKSFPVRRGLRTHIQPHSKLMAALRQSPFAELTLVTILKVPSWRSFLAMSLIALTAA
jgi:hypothetical protein